MSEINSTFQKSKLSDEFKPAFGLRNPHSQTILSSVGFRKRLISKRFQPYVSAQRQMLLSGGEDVRLVGYLNQAGKRPARQLAILIHGWEGSHESTYIQSMAVELLKAGIDVFRLNLRDHGDSHHLNKALFNSTLIDEVMLAIEDLQSRLVYEQSHLIGFSLGGNFSLRVGAMAHELDISLNSVIAFCPLVHAAQSNLSLNQASNFVYGRYFVRKWKRSLRKKLEHWPEYDYADKLNSLKTLHEMNEALVPAYTDFKDTKTYFDAYAINGERMAKTIAPCYLFFAKDDMIIPIEGIHELADNPDIHITVTEQGGHCGYIKNWKWDCWQDEQALKIIQQFG